MTATATTVTPTATTAGNPQQALDLRDAARYLVAHPLVLAEHEPEMFLLIRRYEQRLDRWFTQRFGYRLQVTTDTARLFKSTVVASRRPLRTASKQSRSFSIREYTMLALALAACAAGRGVTSLRDLIHEIRSAATDAGVRLTEEYADRRALVTALRWMVGNGVMKEMHDSVYRYVSDSEADAVLQIRSDRVALLPMPVLARSETVADVLDRSDQGLSTRARMRSLLLEEPVIYRHDLTDEQWTTLRQRLRVESSIFDEMFGLHIETRSEGVAAIDPQNQLTDSRFPRPHTVGHAALLLIVRLIATDRTSIEWNSVTEVVASLAEEHRRYWSQRLAGNLDLLTRKVLELLQDHRLVEMTDDIVHLLPAAWRYSVKIETGVQTPLL